MVTNSTGSPVAIDSPDNLNAFLLIIGGSPVAPSSVDGFDQSQKDGKSGNDVVAEESATRHTAQPSTPARDIEQLVKGDAADLLLQLDKTSSMKLRDSKFAHAYESKPVVAGISLNLPSHAPLENLGANEMIAKTQMTTTQTELLSQLEKNKEVSDFGEFVLAEHRANIACLTSQKEPSPVKTRGDFSTQAPLTGERAPATTQDTITFPDSEDIKKKVPENNSQNPGPQNFPAKAIKFSIGTPPKIKRAVGEKKVSIDNLENASAETASKVAELGSIKSAGSQAITLSCRTDSEVDREHDSGDENEEDRENLKVFKTWGTPADRGKPRSRVRRVILKSLPYAADLTLVQALISGGAIDTYVLSPSGETAYVTFTSGDACDAYYDKYPNGVTFKYNGKTHTVFVEKNKDLEPISGMLQGYLECGATRVVRVIDVEEDWSMRALYKIAEGDKKSRKVEAIMDSYKNKVRTIIFRFTCIMDAVHFRRRLTRDTEWEGATVTFAEDPCTKATGVHLE